MSNLPRKKKLSKIRKKKGSDSTPRRREEKFRSQGRNKSQVGERTPEKNKDCVDSRRCQQAACHDGGTV